MYASLLRARIRAGIRRLNEGDHVPLLRSFAPGADLCFPGENSWSRQFRTLPPPGERPRATHRGTDEIEAFLRRYVGLGIQMVVEDVIVSGPPWRTRVAVRVHHWIPGENPGENGEPIYANRAVLLVHVAWGRITHQEDYEDTERVAALDRRLLGG